MPPTVFSIPSCLEASDLSCEAVPTSIWSRIFHLLANVWPAFKHAIKAIFFFIIYLPWTIPAAIMTINDYTYEHPYGCGISMILQFITRLPILFLLISWIPMLIYSLMLSMVGQGVTGVKGGTLTADFRKGSYTYGACNACASCGEESSGHASTKEHEEPSVDVSPLVMIFPSKIRMAFVLTQFVVFVWGLFVLCRQLFSSDTPPMPADEPVILAT